MNCLKIIICEDDLVQRQFILNEIIKYSTFHLSSVEVVLSASKPEEVLNYINNYSADCYFLDIEYGNDEIDGLELAKSIREKDSLCNIIFISSFSNKLNLTFKYKIAALDFIIKTTNTHDLSKNIIESLNIAHNRYLLLGKNDDVDILQIKVGENIKNIKYNDIYYFETAQTAHKIRVHSRYGFFEFYGKMKELENLDDRFCRCHNSYLINIHHLKEFNPKKRTVVMSNSHECLVSYRYSKNIKKYLV